jgi:hypothetical protein
MLCLALNSCLNSEPTSWGHLGIYLFYHEGMRLSEIAVVQEVPLNTVKTRLYRGKAKLRLSLEKQDEFR